MEHVWIRNRQEKQSLGVSDLKCACDTVSGTRLELFSCMQLLNINICFYRVYIVDFLLTNFVNPPWICRVLKTNYCSSRTLQCREFTTKFTSQTFSYVISLRFTKFNLI